MDPITLIVTALSAGARATRHNGALAVLPGAHTELMALARQRLHGRPNGAMVLRQYAEDPARWGRALATALDAEGVAGDAALIASAQALRWLTDEAGSGRGKYALPAEEAGRQ
jgi:hypothetical protein